ncbi:MAG: hypothetical protein F6K47_30190 [Symploca sp. SIO2E6]|nr:hypothetical protein [Symploca sp. SIO2E6]
MVVVIKLLRIVLCCLLFVGKECLQRVESPFSDRVCQPSKNPSEGLLGGVRQISAFLGKPDRPYNPPRLVVRGFLVVVIRQSLSAIAGYKYF